MRIIALAVAIICLASGQTPAQPPALPTFALRATADKPALDAVFEKLDVYLEKYEGELSAVVADEILVQEVQGRFLQRRTRRVSAEIAFLRLPGNLEWLGFRHARIVDGKLVAANGPSLTQLLATNTTDTIAQASLLVNESSKHNLGNPRTINMPNLPLELLNRRYRHRYAAKLDGRERVRRHAVDVIALEEIGPPPIVYSGGYDLKSQVRAWVEVGNGVLWRAEVRLKRFNDPETSRLRVEFAFDKGLGVMVPIEMREDFFVDLGSGRGHYTYANFRRFQTSARIVPQP
jgi:hypothetical protein